MWKLNSFEVPFGKKMIEFNIHNKSAKNSRYDVRVCNAKNFTELVNACIAQLERNYKRYAYLKDDELDKKARKLKRVYLACGISCVEQSCGVESTYCV